MIVNTKALRHEPEGQEDVVRVKKMIPAMTVKGLGKQLDGVGVPPGELISMPRDHRHSASGSCHADFTELLDALGIEPDDQISVCFKTPGGPFTPTLGHAKDAPARAAAQAGRADVWLQVSPIRADAYLQPGERGKAEHVSRIPALWADLDVKPVSEGGTGSTENCRKAIHALGGLLGGRQPVAVVHSGSGGMQPYWRLEPYDPDEHPRAVRLLRWWGVVVMAVAMEMGGGADNVFDPPRILRVPGTVNRKQTGGPVTVEFIRDDNPDVEADSITLDELEECLASSGVREETPPSGSIRADDPVAMKDWREGRTCAYTRRMLDGWSSDVPGTSVRRRNWCLSQAVRLFSALRLGCLAGEDLLPAVHVLSERFVTLHRMAGLKPEPREFEGILAWAQSFVEAASEDYLQDDYRHEHRDRTNQSDSADEAPPSDDLWTASPQLTAIRAFALHRMVAPEAMLGVILLQVAAVIPPHVVLPPLIGGYGSLNSFVALVGPSGSGKGAAERAARDAIYRLCGASLQ